MPTGIAFATLILALFGAWLAERKFQFDLFVRRYDAYQAATEAIRDRITEIQAIDDVNQLQIEALRRFWTAQRPIRFLFPLHVTSTMKEIQQALLEYSIARAELLGFRENREPKNAVSAYLDANSKLDALQTKLFQAVEPSLRQETAPEFLRRISTPR